MNKSKAIETESLTKHFGSLTAIENINFTVQRGEVFGLLGPNGAGKSTIIDLVLGLTTPSEGRVLVFGTDVASNPRSVRSHVGILPENYGVYEEMSGRENLRAVLRLKDTTDDLEHLRETVGLDSEAFDRPAGNYSKGMMQRLVLAAALAGEPDLLILDEPTSGLDPEGIALVRELVRERADNGTTVFFSSHRLDEVEKVCDRVGIVNDGRLLSVAEVDQLADRENKVERIQLFIQDSPDKELFTRLETKDSVAGICADGQRLAVDCETPAVKADVVEVVNRYCSVRDFEVNRTALEDVFDATVERDRPESRTDENVASAAEGNAR
ncbi:ABC transporter ATP-binding protein [Halorussus pelagicus]|uniref:ABC transporter ATP-binding protein n=1 Tax=Halorussus pelagicus TaxID=2505977 RepID=UPI0014086908|nr:ABC transporter ATP-binding protein [Halorussus pelagicus]